jgi:site-specific DNA-methyltransferase (cytosine-N4-specific)
VLLRLLLTSILEEVSYTRKDGQYLRWDCRAQKVQVRNHKREQNGKPAIKGMHKGDLPSVKEALLAAMFTIIEDIKVIQQQKVGDSTQQLLQGSSLEILPTLEPDQFAGVITSPPYCNRYDYTRTYALEIAYLGAGEEGIRELRQEQLSCTVEHNSKVNELRAHYNSLDQSERFERILHTIQNNPVFREIIDALQIRWDRGEINNRGILPMVEGYFVELTFIFAEILRTVRSGAHVAFVNDNVRYGGEIIPVDLLTTAIAEDLGFVAEKVYVLPQRKGNSSQQMGRFGREALRKSITVWKKP